MKNRLKLFRKYAAKKLLDKKTRQHKVFDIRKIKSILFLRYDNKIGDMVISTLMFREIKKQFPDIKIYVLCGKDSGEIIRKNPYVDEIVELKSGFFSRFAIFRYLKNKKIDAAIDFYQFKQRPLKLLMLRIIDPGYLIGFHKQDYNMYDMSVDCDINEMHITKRYEHFMNMIGVEVKSLKYDIFIDAKQEEKAKSLMVKSKNNILINPFAASKHRSFSFYKLQNLINHINKIKEFNVSVYVLCVNSSLNLLKGLKGAEIVSVDSIQESAALVKYCDCVITPDTAIVHIAAAFNKRMISIYLDFSSKEERNDKVWAPGYDNAVQLCVDTKNGMFEDDIKSINNNLIVEALLNFFKGIN
jgi:ADP-heptose:LPS heptosyltransferase